MNVSELIEELRKDPPDFRAVVELERNSSYADVKVRHMRLIDTLPYEDDGNLKSGLYIDMDTVVIGSYY